MSLTPTSELDKIKQMQCYIKNILKYFQPNFNIYFKNPYFSQSNYAVISLKSSNEVIIGEKASW